MSRALVLALLVACGGDHKTTTVHDKPRAVIDMAACTTAEDCTLVEACCGCNNVGRRVAIRKDAIAEYDASRPQRCSGNVCKPGISSHSSCDAEAICTDGHCKVQPHMGGLP